MKRLLSNCSTYQGYNVQKRVFHSLPSIVDDIPWDHFAMDLVTPLPLRDGGKYTLIVITKT